jgi:hypothetical protein
MKRILTISLAALVLFTACKKEVKELPQNTQTGANTFGAKINGQLWAPQGFGPVPANNLLEARMIGNDLLIDARNFASSPNETEFSIRLVSVTDIGVYTLNSNATHPSLVSSYCYYVKRNLTPQNEWITSTANTGSVTITKLDLTNKIVSGTFQFNALNIYNAPEPLAVTEGRFDIKLQ